jgi:hypothetical protein
MPTDTEEEVEEEEEDDDNADPLAKLFAASFEKKGRKYFCKAKLAGGMRCDCGPLNKWRILAHASGTSGQGTRCCKGPWSNVQKQQFKELMQLGASAKREQARKREDGDVAVDSMMGSAISPPRVKTHPFSSLSGGTRISTGGTERATSKGLAMSPRCAGG